MPDENGSAARWLSQLVDSGNPLSDKADCFGVLFHSADHMFSKSGTSARVVSESAAATRDDANCPATQGNQTDGKATDGEPTRSESSDSNEYPN